MTTRPPGEGGNEPDDAVDRLGSPPGGAEHPVAAEEEETEPAAGVAETARVADGRSAKAKAEIEKREIATAGKKAEELQRRHATDALLALSTGAVADARYHLRLHKLYSRGFQANRRTGAVKPLLVVALPCVALVSVLHAVPLSVIKDVSFILDVEARSVSLGFSSPWELEEPLVATGMTLRRARHITATFLEDAPESAAGERDFSADATGSVKLTGLRVDSGGALELAAERNALGLIVWGEHIDGGTMLTGMAKVRTSGGGAPVEVDATVPETLDFTASERTLVPLEIRFQNPRAWSLSRLRPTSLGFASQDGSPLKGQFFSSVLRGSIRILDGDSSRLEALVPDDALVLGPTVCRHISVTPGEGTLHVVADCASNELRAGPAGFERSLVPSLLEVLYKKQALATFWAALVFLWGLGWGTKKLLRGAGESGSP